MSLIYNEGIVLLFEGSLRAIPFNIILALLLALDLLYNKAPYEIVVVWTSAIILFSALRWFFCRYVIKNNLYESAPHVLLYFMLFTLFMGSIWGACYWLMLPYISILQEFIIILVFGGMSAGAITSLSAYLPAYYAYILPMFLPIIVYNYWVLDVNRAILATMFLLFVIMILISAKINNRLLNRVFLLSREKETLISDLQILSITDSLTGLYNRRHFELALQKEYEKAHLNHQSLVLVSIDVDNFKLINDIFGHPSGDNFLIYFAKLLKNIFHRDGDIICRIGGDEFSIILVNQTIEEVMALCSLLNSNFNTNKSEKRFIMREITLSMSIVSMQFNCYFKIENLITFADEALYQAKKEGKNKMIVKELLT